MPEPVELSLAEWVVLGVIDERPTHGFAVAAVTAPGGALGRVWQVPRPMVYRAMGRLADLALIVPEGVEPGRGPRRTVYAVTGDGHVAVRRWLQTPVGHIRDVRSHLLLKLALLDRRGAGTANLIRRQRAAIAPIARAVTSDLAAAEGFDRTLLAWRRATAAATVAFLDDVGTL